MILANKAATALELLGRISMGYEYLPHWIKPACLVYNKGELTFANMSSIRAFASSSDAARGFSANCVNGETKILVKRKWIPFSKKEITVEQFVQKMQESLSYVKVCNDNQEYDYDEFCSGKSEKKSECIKKKFSDVFYINGWQVKTNEGWKDINAILMGKNAIVGSLKLKSGKTLICTPMHIVIGKNGNEVYANEAIGEEIITNDGIDVVESYELQNDKQNVYDFCVHSDQHVYYTNGILSHNCVILDEFAFLQKSIADKLFTSMFPVISSSKNGKFIIVSTPNGTDNLYYDIWCQANTKEVGKNLEGWKPFEMHWFDVPGHNEEWKQRQIAAIGAQRFAQEFDNQFLAKGNDKKLIPDEVISRYKIKLSEYKSQGIAPKKQKIISQAEDELYEFDMWREFKPNRTYLASADISEGIGGDSSVLYIWDVTDLRNIVMCAKFSSNTVSLVQFAYIASKMLALYNNPWLAAERNGVSAGMLDSLRITYGYSNIIVENKKREPGIYSHVQVKSKACLWAREMMTNECFGFTIYDKDLVDEMSLFIKKDTKNVHNVYHAMPGPNSHDDHMLAFIWATFALNNDRVNDYFIVCDTTTTQIGVVYAKILQPLNPYTTNAIDAISKDPLYKEFLEFKNEAIEKSRFLEKAFKQDDEHDIFKYESVDPYFGDDDEGSWNNIPLNWNMDPNFQQGQNRNISLGNSNHTLPSFFVN